MSKEEKKGRAVSAWDPFGELDLLERWPLREIGLPSRLSRLLQERRGEGIGGDFAPAVDITEADSAYVITAEVAGCKKDDVNVEVHDKVLTVSGEKRSEREEKKEKSRWVERSYGRFTRSFTLPADADPGRIDASFKEGVLTVTIAKTEETKPQQISIKS
jgi:HSP20 family protein